jgi:hypothetical protein
MGLETGIEGGRCDAMEVDNGVAEAETAMLNI